MDENLTFDEEKHRYRYKGVIVPSVTQILSHNDKSAPFYSREGSARGSAVHQCIYLDIMNDLNYDSIHPKIKPYFNGWLNFKNNFNFEPIRELCELPQYNPVHNYAGTPDLIIRTSKEYMLIDVKTGSYKTAAMQLAAYSNFPLIKQLSPVNAVLSINARGDIKLRHYPGINQSFLMFLREYTKYKRTKGPEIG